MSLLERIKKDQELLKQYLKGEISKEELERQGVKLAMPIKPKN